MENGSAKWRFIRNDQELMNTSSSSTVTVRNIFATLMENVNESDDKPTISLALGDPSAFPCFRTTPVAEDAIVDAVRSAKFNHYPPATGILPAKRSVAEYLSRDLPYDLSPDDVYLTLGANHAIGVILTVLARAHPGANVLLPRPGYPLYEACAAFSHFEVRHYDLLPDKGWEVDLDGMEALTDDKTVAMVIINPGNPCGNVFTYENLQKVAETARKLGILVIADEVYRHLCIARNPFVPMGVFGSIAPVLTLGSISKRWFLPGWRLGWIVTTDPNGILQESRIVGSMKSYFNVAPDPVTFVQGAIPQILEKSPESFFLKTTNILRETADICCNILEEIPCITCPHKPEGAMSVMVKLNLSLLEGIYDDMDFCVKLAKEESVIIMPGVALGLKNWLRITFAVEPASLENGLRRVKAFCLRHAKT